MSVEEHCKTYINTWKSRSVSMTWLKLLNRCPFGWSLSSNTEGIVRSIVCRKTRTSSLDTRFFERIHNGRFTQSPTHDMMCYCIMRGDMIWHGMIWNDTTLYETTSWVWQHDNMMTQYDFMSYHKIWWHWWVLVEKNAMTSTISMGVEEAPRCCRFAVSLQLHDQVS